MLTQIHIRDLATIEALHLDLAGGCTMITGETGAGKSIFIEAIELGLGGRASPNLVRVDKEKAEISLCFDISNFPKVIHKLTECDLYENNPECIIRRVITQDGRSRCYINGTPVNLQLVKELGELLFHLHSQHEQQVLLKAETQREMLDRYADHLSLAASIKETVEAWREISQTIATIHAQALERNKKTEFLQFQLEELNNLNLHAGEWEALEAEHNRMTHAEELIRSIQHVLAQLNADTEENIATSLHEIRKIFDTIQALDPKVTEWNAQLHSILIQLNEMTAELRDYLDDIDIDPEKLQILEARVSQIYNLARKHKIQPAQLVQFTQALQAQLENLNASEGSLIELESQQQQLATKYQAQSQQLSQQRQQAAKKLEQEITCTIRSLSLPHGEFKIDLTPDSSEMSPYGQEKIDFLIKINPDQHLMSLAKAVSGGELSRLSLAAHLALANRTTIPTLIFDEVDTGLGGATAEKIGKLLRQLGNSYQVFCITHQPQVAACGEHHLLVEKHFIKNKTHTQLRLLDKQEKAHEIARMLSGEVITRKTLEHAKEIMNTA